MGRLKISTFSTNSLKMLKMKSNKGWRTGESRNYRAIFQRAKQNTRSPPAPAAEIHGEFGAGLGLSALCRHSAEPRGLRRVEPDPVLLQPVPELPCLNDESKPSSRDRRCCSLPRGHCWGFFLGMTPLTRAPGTRSLPARGVSQNSCAQSIPWPQGSHKCLESQMGARSLWVSLLSVP